MVCALVVDDSPASAHAVAAELAEAGYGPVHVATDWAECHQALTLDPPPALVVLDVQMVGMVSGDVMAMQLRRNPRCAGARFLLYSGLSARDLEPLARRCGADAFLQKSRAAELGQACRLLVPPDRDPKASGRRP